MFSIHFFNSFHQNYSLGCLFVFICICLFVCLLVVDVPLSTFSVLCMFCSFLNSFGFRLVCFSCACIAVNHFGVRYNGSVVSGYRSSFSFSHLTFKGVNHFSVDIPGYNIKLGSGDVNHFSVENLRFLKNLDIPGYNIKLGSGDVNHFSVENLRFLKNLTLRGESNTRYSSNKTVVSISEFLRIFNFVTSDSKNFQRGFPLIMCVITTLLKLFVRVGVRLANYRVIDTPSRILLRKRRPKSRKLQLITVIGLLIFIFIKANEASSSEVRSNTDTQNFDYANPIVSLFVLSKGRPLNLNFLLLLLLSGDIETNPGPATMKTTCESCLRTIARTHRKVTCVECGSSYHMIHSDVTPQRYNLMQIDRSITFTCEPCVLNQLPFAGVEILEDLDDVVIPQQIESFNLSKGSSLNIAHLNVNGIRSKLDFIKILLRQEKFDIFCINETKIDSTVTDSVLSIPGYVPYRQDRTAHGGGTLIYASTKLTTNRLRRLSKKDFEAVWIEIRPKMTKPIYVCSVYRPPSSKAIENATAYSHYLSSCLNQIKKGSEVFILGDLNIDISKKNNLSSIVNELCKSKGLTQHVKSPTRVTEHSSTTIDLALSNSVHAKDCQVIELGISDHSLVFIRREKTKIERKGRVVKTRSYKNFNNEAFLDDLGNIDWSGVLNTTDIDLATENFNSNVLTVLNRHAPLIERRVPESSPPWIDEVLLTAISERDYLKKVAARSKDPIDFARAKNKRNFVIKLKNRLKREYYQRVLMENRSNSRKLWRTLNEIAPSDKKSNSSPNSLKNEGVEITDKKKMASVFNKFFATVGSKLAETFHFYDTSHINTPINPLQFNFSNVNMSVVQKIVSQLDTNKATGLDGITARSLKAGSPILSFYLAYLFNLSLTTGRVPKAWKKKRVTPVFKKGDTDDVNNYRPISILPISMKIFEKVVHYQVSDFLDSCKLLSPSQSGFRHAHSTDTAVICVSDFILNELGKGKYVGAVLVDLKKAFDTVDHRILLKKLFCYGIRDVSLDWFQSYLGDRFQCTLLENTLSDLTPENHFGVPQGSVLGPLLFLLYINDIGDCIKTGTFYHLYADDTIIIQSADDPDSLRAGLSGQLKDLGQWFYHCKLSVNTSKTEVIFFGRSKKVQDCKSVPPLKFLGDVIESKTEVKYLGVVFDENMTWDQQAKRVRSKAYLALNRVKQVSSLLTEDAKKLLTNALVMPHISYCSNSWSTMSVANRNKFESLMRNVNKVAPLNKTFKQVSDINKAVMMFKGIHKIAPAYLCDQTHLVKDRHDRVTRFADQNNVVVPRSKTRFNDRTFIHSASQVWNNLPTDVKSVNSFLLFRNSVKKHILN